MLKFFSEKNSRYASLRRGLEILMVLVLSLYPLRHIHVGLDLWDVGYNYSNFEFMGTESMDPMWLFSTYLATALGHLFTFLPFGKTLLGLNLYTSLTISFLAVIGYVFFTRKLEYPPVAVFLGEFIAINLCWCPTALLYNFLTYIMMTLGVIYIFLGLRRGKYRYLFIAGVCLGLNVFVRFSNLPEAALILAVWAYGILELIEKKKEASNNYQKKRERIDFLKRTGMRTLFCILGYAAAVLGMLLFMTVRYGLDNYVNGIRRLFSMTSDNYSYTPFSMVYAIYGAYKSNLKWILCLCIAVSIGTIIVFLCKMLDAKLGLKQVHGKYFKKGFTFTVLSHFIVLIIGAVFIYFLCTVQLGEDYSRFGQGSLTEYGSIIVPGIVFTFIIILWGIGVVVKPGESLSEKLMAGLVILVLIITPIGSNNGHLTCLNNLFLVAPWFVYRLWRLIRRVEPEGIVIKVFKREHKELSKKDFYLAIVRSYFSYFPLKAIIVMVVGLCFARFVIFGWGFTFAEAKNAENPTTYVEGGKVLDGIRMSPEKAENMKGLIDFVESESLPEGTESITYGYIPAVSFYLQLPPAFNPWVDLGSYTYDVMKENIDAVKDSEELPVIVLTEYLSKYVDGKNDVFDRKEITDEKFKLIVDLIDDKDYELVYQNDMFAVLESDRR